MVNILLNGALASVGAFSVVVNVIVIKWTFFDCWKSRSASGDSRHLQYFNLLFANSCLGLVTMFEGATYGWELPLWACSLKMMALQIFGLASFCWCARIIHASDSLIRNIFLWNSVPSTVSVQLDHLIGWGIPLFVVLIMLCVNISIARSETFCWRAVVTVDYTLIYLTAIIFLLPHAIILVYLIKLSFFYFSIRILNSPLNSTIQRVRGILFVVLGLRLLYFVTRVTHALMLDRNDALINFLYFFSPLILSLGDTLAFSILLISRHFSGVKSLGSTASPTGDTGVTPDDLETSHFIQDVDH